MITTANRYFVSRQEAGQALARALAKYRGEQAVVLALPRGGVVLGAEICRELNLPLGVVLVRKIGHPAYSEYAIGAVAEDQPPIYNSDEVELIDKSWLKQAEDKAHNLIKNRRTMYYGDELQPPDIKGKTAIIVDDGIATGLTMQAAIMAVRNKDPQKIVIAVPVASEESISTLEELADEIIVLEDSRYFLDAIGAHYLNFEQVSDEEVTDLLQEVNGELH